MEVGSLGSANLGKSENSKDHMVSPASSDPFGLREALEVTGDRSNERSEESSNEGMLQRINLLRLDQNEIKGRLRFMKELSQ